MAWKRRYRNYRKSRRGRYNRKLRRKTFQRKVRKAILKTAETKYKVLSGEDTPLYHDRGDVAAGVLASTQGAVIFNPWYQVTKGTSVSNRVGDEIYARGIALRMAYWSSAVRLSQFVRVIVATIPRVYRYPGAGAPQIQDGTNMDLMDPAGSNDTVTGMIVREGVKCLYDRVFTLHSPGRSDADEKGDSRMFKKLWIKNKRNRKIKYDTNGYVVNNPIGVWVIPYDDYQTLRSDILGYLTYTAKLYFKDP